MLAAFGRAIRTLVLAVIPNPWDRGSARYRWQLGFKALAVTSSGAAWRDAKADGQLSLEEALAHLRDMVAATSLPVNADFVVEAVAPKPVNLREAS